MSLLKMKTKLVLSYHQVNSLPWNREQKANKKKAALVIKSGSTKLLLVNQ